MLLDIPVQSKSCKLFAGKTLGLSRVVRIAVRLDNGNALRGCGPERGRSFGICPFSASRYRNRRVGESFKELDLTEGRCIGIPKMRAAMERNGSPEPRFSTDETRTHFAVELPVHPELVGLVVHDEAHDEAHDRAHDELTETESRVLRFLEGEPRSRPEIADHLGLNSRSGNFYKAIDRLRNLGFVELTIPDKPQSKNQKMRITGAGLAGLKGRMPKDV